eukprot:TRINITY_DN3145_c0_g1_i1.p1 TRINITY_DN3145_c0_g1~~TRINITY_DN3145_c0_g1_i1.p1  ORF type:complete len:251 (+),score=27.49 TRINITY_DN3145_c0_g1_i1:8-760(+)
MLSYTTDNDLHDDIWLSVFSYLKGSEIGPLVTVCKKFHHLLSKKWLEIVQSSPLLQKKRRLFYHYQSKKLSVVYKEEIEKVYAIRFMGSRSSMVSAVGLTNLGINITVRVRPCALGHTVGAVYTFNGWRTTQKSHGWWVRNEKEEEIWTINIWHDEEDPNEDLWFSVFAKDDAGNEAWDANEGWNYSVNLLNIESKTYGFDSIHENMLHNFTEDCGIEEHWLGESNTDDYNMGRAIPWNSQASRALLPSC